jgi:hypothetical protein
VPNAAIAPFTHDLNDSKLATRRRIALSSSPRWKQRPGFGCATRPTPTT